MNIILSLVFIYKIFSISLHSHNLSKHTIGSINASNIQKDSVSDLLVLEKKIIKDFLYKKLENSLFFSNERNFNTIYLDKESKILGNKKKFECTQQKLFFTLTENKKFLKSTLFGIVRLVT